MYEMRQVAGSHVGEGSPEKELGRKREGEYQLRDCFTSMKDGPVVEFRKRS